MISTIPRLHRIHTKTQLAQEIGVPLSLVRGRAFEATQATLYSQSTQRKRSGGERIIHAPYWPLANIQRKILALLEEIYRPSSRVMGFVKGRGIKQNAKFHVGKRLILNLDIQDYFGSIHAGRIRRRLMARPYSMTDDVATTIARLCSLDGFLPTGAPTSPILANIVTSALDGALNSYAKQNGCFYTRYADDVTFSTNRKSFPQSMVRRSEDSVSGVEIGDELNALFVEAGFVIQPTKTRLMNKSMRQEVCGVTCNERLNVRRTLMREVRGAIHAWRKHGIVAASAKWNEKHNWRQASSFERSLRGKIQYIIHIKGENDAATANLVSQFNELEGRQFKDLNYVFEVANPLGILTSVCLVECSHDDAMMWSQGTGFIIEGGAVVTNYHVISYRPEEVDGKLGSPVIFPEINVQPEGAPISYRMKVVWNDPAKDLAILRCEDPVWECVFLPRDCSLSFKELKTGEAISLAGYPSHEDGASCKVFRGYVTGTMNSEGQKYFSISEPIVKGNSGGPVFDEFGQVVGIATKGVDATDIANLMSNGCIPLHTLDRIILTDT